MSQRVNKLFKILKIMLILGSVLAAIKVIFVDYTLDEEYQVVMAYRNLSGDTLFGTMWEPHQTSAFLCAWLMRLYIAVTGTTTGVVVFLRVCTTVIQLLLSLWLCRVLEHFLQSEYAFLLGLCYFNIVPKIIQIPEFSNLQVWFYTVIMLALTQYYMDTWDFADAGDLTGQRLRGGHLSGRRLTGGHLNGRRLTGGHLTGRLWLVAAGLGMALEVLSYPSSLVLFPFFLLYIFFQSGRAGRGLLDCLIFAGTCGVSAAVWLWRVLSHVSPEEFLQNVWYVVNFDLTHDISLTAQSRTMALIRDFKTLAVLFFVTAAVALVLWQAAWWLQKRKNPDASRPGGLVFAVWMILAAEAVQLFYWLVPRKGYEEPQIHLIVILLAAVFVWRRAGSRRKAAAAGFAGSLLTILAVVYMSDMGVWYAIPHGLLGVLLGAAVLIFALEEQYGEKGRCWVYLLLFSLAFVSVFGKGFTLRAGKTPTNTVLGVGGIIRKGPSAGIFTGYMQAYITNSTYDEFQEYVEPGSNCLIVTNMVGTAGTSPYLFTGARVCHFSVVDPTSYDERLLTYWGRYPGKEPDVIVVDCWYGELKEAEDSWIMQYIENDFGYTQVVDGKYVRYYIRGR